MPKQCYNHDELRRRVCVGCLRPGCERVVPEHYIGAIKSQVFKDFDPILQIMLTFNLVSDLREEKLCVPATSAVMDEPKISLVVVSPAQLLTFSRSAANVLPKFTLA